MSQDARDCEEAVARMTVDGSDLAQRFVQDRREVGDHPEAPTLMMRSAEARLAITFGRPGLDRPERAERAAPPTRSASSPASA